MGQQELDRQNKTARIELTEQDCLQRATKIRHTELYILLKTLAFPPAERLWAQKPDFHCGWEKEREFVLFLSRSALSLFSRFFFLRAFALFWLRAREREKSAGAHLWL